MSSVNHLVDEILRDAEEKAASILEEARGEALQLENEAREAAGKALEEAQLQAQRETREYEARVRSQIDMKNRQVLLSSKQELVQTALQEAGEALENQEAPAYFAMLEKLLLKNLRPQAGELCLSEKDLQRLPEDFMKKAEKAAKEAGGSLSLSEKGAPIESGLLLKYGGIEINCSLKALFAENKDLLSDAASKALFPESMS